MTEDEMVRWYHRPNGHEFEQTLEDSEGQGSLACCSPRGAKGQTQLSDRTTTICKMETSLTLESCSGN